MITAYPAFPLFSFLSAEHFCFLNSTPSDMARVYNWDVKRRNKEDPSKNKA